MLRDLIIKNRSYRRFIESNRISRNEICDWLELARFSASGMNAQALKYIIVTDVLVCSKVFPLLSWAAYLKDWTGPIQGERPAAYIIQVHDTDISSNYFCDDGIAAQSILLGAVEAGYGACILASIKRDGLRETFGLSERYNILQVIALGEPSGKIVLEEMKGDDFKYWRDDEGVHHVPKRSLDELILF